MLLNIIGILGALFGLAMTLLVFALPFLFLYAVYRVIKGLMTHDANLKRQNQRDNDRWNEPPNRY